MDPGECSRTSQHANTSTRHVYRDSLSGICSRVCNPYPPFHSAFDNYIPNPRNIVSTDCKLQFITSSVVLEQRTFISTSTFLLFSVQLCILHLSDKKLSSGYFLESRSASFVSLFFRCGAVTDVRRFGTT